jgi:hypothetical protein
VVDFDDVQVARPAGLAVGERVQPRTQDRVLANATANRFHEAVFHVPAPNYNVAAQGAGDRSSQPIGVLLDRSRRFRVKEAQCQRVVEDGRWIVDQEMRRPQPRGPEGGRAGGSLEDDVPGRLDVPVRPLEAHPGTIPRTGSIGSPARPTGRGAVDGRV